MPETYESRTGARTETRLVIPERFVIDEISYERLGRLLERAPANIAGVVAETGDLPPGSSYRVHSEWRALEPASACTPASSTSAGGAVMLRGDVEYAVTDDKVVVPRGPLLVDAGSYVHDQYRAVGPLSPASELGRSPFPWRPVVVFLGLEPDDEREEFARRLVNRLMRREIEARLATVGAVTPGPHLTRPCAPVAESIRALAPDVIITLDESAARIAPSWCTERSTVIVHYETLAERPIELVSWQIDQRPGRVRARIDRRVDPSDLVDVIHRLAAGPQPEPPRDLDAEPRTLDAPARTAARALTVIHGGNDGAATARMRGLVDNLTAIGVDVDVRSASNPFAGARSTPLLLLVDVAASRIDALIEARRDEGLHTVVDFSVNDLRADGLLSDRAQELARAAGLVTGPPGAVHRAARSLGVRALAVPTLLTRRRAAELVWAQPEHDPARATIGWRLDTGAPDLPTAAVDALGALLAERPDVHVIVVGDPARLPADLRRHARVGATGADPGPEVIAGWTVHLWTPGFAGGHLADDLRAVVEASCASVPTVLPAPARASVEGYTAPDLVVADPNEPQEWAAALMHAIDADAERRAQLSRRTAVYARNVYGATASKIAANRFYGWAAFEGEA